MAGLVGGPDAIVAVGFEAAKRAALEFEQRRALMRQYLRATLKQFDYISIVLPAYGDQTAETLVYQILNTNPRSIRVPTYEEKSETMDYV